MLRLHDVALFGDGHYRSVGIRVVVVDDHAMFAEAIAARLAAVAGIEVAGIACDAARARLLIRSVRPDVITLDVNLGDEDGIELARELSAAGNPARTIVVSCVDDVDRVLRAIWAGVVAWVPKETATSTLIAIVRGVVRGHGWLPPEMTADVLRTIVNASGGQQPDGTRLAVLTPREREVLRCMVGGLDRGATAAHLGLSLNTVRTHAQSVLNKLHVHSALEAVSVALDCGMRPSRALIPEPRLGVIRQTEPPRVAFRPSPQRTFGSSRSLGAIGVGVLVRWPDRKQRANS
jgi:two-component system NarL family response regulator